MLSARIGILLRVASFEWELAGPVRSAFFFTHTLRLLPKGGLGRRRLREKTVQLQKGLTEARLLALHDVLVNVRREDLKQA